MGKCLVISMCSMMGGSTFNDILWMVNRNDIGLLTF